MQCPFSGPCRGHPQQQPTCWEQKNDCLDLGGMGKKRVLWSHHKSPTETRQESINCLCTKLDRRGGNFVPVCSYQNALLGLNTGEWGTGKRTLHRMEINTGEFCHLPCKGKPRLVFREIGCDSQRSCGHSRSNSHRVHLWVPDRDTITLEELS